MSKHQAIGGKIFTGTFAGAFILALIGGWFLIQRFAQGLGAVTNMSDGYPWGIWITYDVVIWHWVKLNPLLHVPAAAGAAVILMVILYGLLRAGSSNADGVDSPRTFRGRRHGRPQGSTGGVLSNWIKHIERVGKIHR